MKFEVDQKLVEPIIRDQIAAAIVSQLGDTTALIQKMIALALQQKVNSEGNISQYSSDNKFDFVEAITGKAIREAARQAIVRIVAEQQPVIQAAIEAELKKAPKKTATAILAAFVENVNQQYRLTANFTIEAPKNN